MSLAAALKPCLVIGTGFHRWVLGDAMAGRFRPLLDWNELLLWLMAQRARNLANVPRELRPKAFILVHERDTRLDFWRSRPCGIEPLICASWEEGWAHLEAHALQHALPPDGGVA